LRNDPGTVPRFARGFTLSEDPIPPPVAGWLSVDVAGLHLSHAPDTDVLAARSGRHFVVVVGHFVDTGAFRPPNEAVRAAVDALASSEGKFFDVTDDWSGRYLVVFGTSAACHVMADATGMRAAFYSLEGPFVMASHARIVATHSGAPASPIWADYQAMVQEIRSRFVTSAPGRLTPWSGVVFLPANQVLDLETRSLRRIFPRRPLPKMATKAAAAALAPRFEGQVTAIARTGRPIALSLTGGQDSRLSLAASRPEHRAITYFTYRRPGRPDTDVDVTAASSMARGLGLRHKVLDVESVVEPGLASAIREATVLSHGRGVVAAYRRAFAPDTIHIRSNVGGVARCFYRSTVGASEAPERADHIGAELLAKLWSHGAPRPTIVEAFADWIEATGFGDVEGLDPLVVFYWEHRLTCWHSNIVLESDFAFDTHVLFNARSILELMLAVPAEDRCTGALFPEVVSILWPELLRWPFGIQRPRSIRAALRRRLPF
jgi:hypothetical protein